MVCSDTGADSAARPWMQDASGTTRSCAAIPFRLKGEIVGVITLTTGEQDTFSEADAEQLGILSTTLTSALDLLDKKTLRRRAARGPRSSWERTRFLPGGIKSAAVPFAAILPDGRPGAVNAALCAMLGFTEDELLALPLTSLPGTPGRC